MRQVLFKKFYTSNPLSCSKSVQQKILLYNRVVFSWLLKVGHICFGFSLLRLVIALKNLHHLSYRKPKTHHMTISYIF